MNRIEITNEITKIFRNTFKDENLVLSNDMTANDVENWDSLTNALMVSELEKHFSIKFKIREIIKLRNVGLLIDLVEKKIN